MSDLLNQASLVMVPSGYKEDTVYSVVPSDGSGDLSFTRASNGTRVNSAGLVEVCPWNLVEYSEDFTNAGWVKQNGISVTSNTITAPNGTTTADTLEKATGSGGINYYYIVTSTNSFEQLTNFFYVKHKSGSGIVWLLGKNTGTFAFFDVINGTALSKSSGMTTSVESVGNGWYKCIFSQSYVGATSTEFGIGLCLVDGTPNYDATSAATQSVYIWGAQSAVGSTAKPYFPTTDRLNVPRLTYQNGGGGCPSLLLEKQSTNEALYSNTLETAAWGSVASGTACSITTNDTTSPDGTQNASKITYNTAVTGSGTYSLWRFTKSTSANGTYSISVWLKAGTITKTYIRFSDSGGNRANLECNLTSEWQRFTLTGATASSISTIAFDIGADGNGGQTQTSGYLYAWGAQLEASSYATSLITTTSSSATRVADLSTSDTIQTAQTFAGDFTMFADFVPFIDSTDANGMMVLGGGASGLGSTYQSYLWFIGSNVYLSGDGEVVIIQRGYSMVVNQRVKIAFTRVGTTVKMFVNGAQVGASATSSTSITIRSIGWSYNLPTYQTKGKINQILLSATGASDADAISLTTL